MGVRESHPLASQAVDVGRGNLRFRIKTLWVSKPHIVGKDQDDIWVFGGLPSRHGDEDHYDKRDVCAYHLH
jgi:hypothetical protein